MSSIIFVLFVSFVDNCIFKVHDYATCMLWSRA